jgi:hypothetical protein
VLCMLCVCLLSVGAPESEVIMAQMSDVAALCLHCDTSEKAPLYYIETIYCSSWDTAKLRERSHYVNQSATTFNYFWRQMNVV